VLGALAEIVRKGRDARLDPIHIVWIALLLGAHFNLFWYTLDLLTAEPWGFTGFLYVISGPVLIFLCTGILVAELSDSPDVGARAHYFRVSGRFFLLFALLQIWIVGVDIVLGRGFTGPGAFNAGVFALVLVLASWRNYRAHVIGAAVGVFIFLAAVALRGMGVIA
jgi:hypothetical protein